MTKWDTIQADVSDMYAHLQEEEMYEQWMAEEDDVFGFTKAIQIDHLTDEQVDEIRNASVTRDGVLHDGTRSGYVKGVEKQNHKLREYITKDNYKKYPELTKFINELRSRPVREHIAKMVGNKDNFAGSFVRLEVLNDVEGFWLKPHCDIPEKLISSLIYVNKTGESISLGTDLYSEDLEFVKTVPFWHNYGYIFHGPNKWHGMSKGKNVKVDVQFWKEEGGVITSLNGTERRDTNIVIEQYVGKYEDFVLTALSLQGNNSIFIDKSQSERKDLLAQFMGLNVFDKLYETATEDIKEVAVLIKNFKKTDFTSELAEKGLERQTKKSELRGFEKTLESRTIDVTDLSDRILGLTKELVPVDGNLDLEILEKKKNDIGRDILHVLSEEKLKKGKLDEYLSMKHYVEWPDKYLVYDKKKKTWVPTGVL